MSSINIYKCIAKCFRRYNQKIFNSFIFDWESDFFVIDNDGYCIEVEIKTSQLDFKNDFNKTTKKGINKHKYLLDPNSIIKPNKFYFAFHSGLINSKDIPNEYGIIECYDERYNILRPAKLLHIHKLLDDELFLSKVLNKITHKTLHPNRIMVNLC